MSVVGSHKLFTKSKYMKNIMACILILGGLYLEKVIRHFSPGSPTLGIYIIEKTVAVAILMALLVGKSLKNHSCSDDGWKVILNTLILSEIVFFLCTPIIQGMIKPIGIPITTAEGWITFAFGAFLLIYFGLNDEAKIRFVRKRYGDVA